MELPPYRMPTVKSALHHMWEKSQQYLKNGLCHFSCIHYFWALDTFHSKMKKQKYDVQIQQFTKKT